MKVAGAVCLVTGGARGLGRGYAEALLKSGAKVCVTDILKDALLKTVDELGSQYGRQSIIGIVADVTDQQQMEGAFDRVTCKLGQLEVVINSAGLHGHHDPVKVYGVNLHGVIRCTDLAVARMRKDKGGRGGVIVNTSGTAGLYCVGNSPHYHASIHGVIGYTRTLDLEMSERLGISFRVLCPGPVETAMLQDYREVCGYSDFHEMIPADGHEPENLDETPLEVVVRACMLCIERDDLKKGATVKAISTGIYLVCPEKAPCEKIE